MPLHNGDFLCRETVQLVDKLWAISTSRAETVAVRLAALADWIWSTSSFDFCWVAV